MPADPLVRLALLAQKAVLETSGDEDAAHALLHSWVAQDPQLLRALIDFAVLDRRARETGSPGVSDEGSETMH